MSQYQRVASVSEISEGQGRQFTVNGVTLAVFKVGEKIYAVDDTCPHRGGPLSDGDLDDCIVACPWHAARFDLRTGAALGPLTSKPVKTYPVRVIGDAVEVAID